MHLEILLEEQSMENVVKALLPRLAAGRTGYTWKTHPYAGKQTLLKQLPKLFRGYSQWIAREHEGDYRIIVIIDQDYDDCIALKQKIVSWSQEMGLTEHTTVRIAVAMLEAWFLGDAPALETVFPKLTSKRIGTKAAYRNPDARQHPAQDLDAELKAAGYHTGYQKLAHSAQIAPFLSLVEEHNRSHSFQVTLTAFRNLLSA